MNINHFISRNALASGSVIVHRLIKLCSYMAIAFAITIAVSSNTHANDAADAARVTATVSADKVQVAEPFTLDLKIVATEGVRVVLPAVGEELGKFDVIDHQDLADVPSSEQSHERIWTRRLKLETITTGDLTIPAMKIQVSSGADSKVVELEAIPVHVISVLEDRADPTQFRDIHSVVDVNVPQPHSYSWIWWTTGGIGLLSLVSASVLLVTRRKSWMTPSQWALSELDELRSTQAAEFNNSEAISYRLSTILRDYLELQFEISAPIQTTQELLNDIRRRKLLETNLSKRFAQVFESADLAKFAGLQMTPAELTASIEQARQLIEETSQLNVDDVAKTSGESPETSRTLASPTTKTNGELN